jgi:hypothetical protein
MRKVGLEAQRLEAERLRHEDAALERKRRAKAMSVGTLIAATDAAIGRDADDDAHYYAASTFAVIWAAIGYVIWISLVLTWRVCQTVVVWITRRGRSTP